MSLGEHDQDDGPGRSASVHAGRAALLIVAALLIGYLVLDDDIGADLTTTPGPPPTTSAPDPSTTTEPPTTTVALRPADQVKVIALNATGTPGVAGRISDQLRVARYDVVAPGNATATARAAAKTSLVYYTAGFTREALLVAQSLGLAPASVQALPNPPPATDLRGANVVVLVKEDLANRPAGASTTTTRQP